MSVPASADDLVVLIRKSGLVDERKLTSFLETHKRDGLLQSDSKKVVATMVREGLLTYFQGEQYLLGKWRGFTLGKFKLLERIGVGGMGQVFLCEHTFMRKRMAVKVLPPTKAEDPVSLGRFYREARVASGLEHANIVRTYDIDQDGPLHFLVMEYMDGTSLLEIVKRFGPMNSLRACHYIRQACIGLQYAHSRGMIHRDIKPGNILVDRQGVAKLLDMGLARFYRDEQDQLTLKFDDKNVLGTADYVAPEQTRDSRNIDIRADIYGMGATFYYILAGQPPFPDGTVADKLKAHQTKKAKPIRELRTDVSQGVARILEKMLAKDPKDRYQTPQDVVDALEVWTQQPIGPPSAEEMPRLSPAAMEPTFATAAKPKPASSHAIRDATFVRPEELATNRSTSSPIIALPEIPEDDIENGVTVPVPPALRAIAAAAASKPMGTGSVVDLVGVFGSRSGGAPPRSPAAPVETRSLTTSGEPTPPRGSQRGSPPTGSQRGSAPAAGSQRGPVPVPVPPPAPPEMVRLPGSKLQGQDGSKLGLPPLRPSAQGTARPSSLSHSAPEPPRPPSIEMPKLRSFHGAVVPPMEKIRSSAMDAPRPPTLDSYRQPKTSGPRDTAAPPPVEPPKMPVRSNVPLGKGETIPPPAYKPPTMMPFFDQPIVASKPGFFTTLLRWLVMIAISTAVGATLGVGIWYQFFRRTV